MAGQGVAREVIGAEELGIQIGGIGEQAGRLVVFEQALGVGHRALAAAVDLDRLDEREVGCEGPEAEGERPRDLGGEGRDVEAGLDGGGAHRGGLGAQGGEGEAHQAQEAEGEQRRAQETSEHRGGSLA